MRGAARHAPGALTPLLQEEPVFSVLIFSAEQQPGQPGFILDGLIPLSYMGLGGLDRYTCGSHGTPAIGMKGTTQTAIREYTVKRNYTILFSGFANLARIIGCN